MHALANDLALAEKAHALICKGLEGKKNQISTSRILVHDDVSTGM